MATRDADLSSLRIDRTSRGLGSPHRSRIAVKIIVWLLVIGALGVAALSLKGFFNPAIEVQLVSASLSSPSQASAVLTASGYVVARRKAAVASKGTGRLVYLGVEEGDRVKKGQLIARLEDDDVVAARRRAEENLRLAEADLYEAEKNLERIRALKSKELIAVAEFDAAEARYKRVVASIEAARFAVREADVAVENTRILAPFDGTVLKKNADVGEIVAPLAGAASSRAAVVTIADMSSLEVDADVAEANITKVFSQQGCEITLDAYPQQRYPGYVSNIVPTADRAKATVLVKIRFKEYDQRVLPEMSAKITFLAAGTKVDAASVKPIVTVPAGAVAERDGRQVVYQIKDDIALEAAVKTGRAFDGLVEIVEGLREGDRVVAHVDDRIRAGMRLKQRGK